jgi:hypothetical protein
VLNVFRLGLQGPEGDTQIKDYVLHSSDEEMFHVLVAINLPSESSIFFTGLEMFVTNNLGNGAKIRHT